VKKFLLLFLLIASLSIAHEDLSDQIKGLNEKIKLNPQNASLYFDRAELHRGDSHWALAEKDYLQARKLSPKMKAVIPG